MTAVVAVKIPFFNEIVFVADSRVSYIYSDEKTSVSKYGLQKIIPIINRNKKSVGVIGFSGYLAPIHTIVHHLIINKKIMNYRAPFVIKEVVHNLRNFIQEGFNKLPEEQRLDFVMMFAAIDTEHQSIIKDRAGNISEKWRFAHPIYLSQTYTFKANKSGKIEIESSNQNVRVIGSGEEASPKLYPLVDNIVKAGRPYDGIPHFRSWMTCDIISDVFQTEQQIKSVGGPYWTWQILDPERQSKCYWQWGVDNSRDNPVIEVESHGNNFVITNTVTGEKRTIYHILSWPEKFVSGALA